MIILLVWTKSELVKKCIANGENIVPSELVISVEVVNLSKINVWLLCCGRNRRDRPTSAKQLEQLVTITYKQLNVDHRKQPTMQHATVNISIKPSWKQTLNHHCNQRGYSIILLNTRPFVMYKSGLWAMNWRNRDGLRPVGIKGLIMRRKRSPRKRRRLRCHTLPEWQHHTLSLKATGESELSYLVIHCNLHTERLTQVNKESVQLLRWG